MLIEAMTKTREKDNFRCYFDFTELDKILNTYVVKVANTLSKNKMAFIRKTFLKREAKHSQHNRGIVCNFNPFEFIKEEFDIVTVYNDYIFLDTDKHIDVLCELFDKDLIDNNSILVGERNYKSGNGSKTVYYLNSTPEIDNILKLYTDSKRGVTCQY